jgi:hypothetical protein
MDNMRISTYIYPKWRSQAREVGDSIQELVVMEQG